MMAMIVMMIILMMMRVMVVVMKDKQAGFTCGGMSAEASGDESPRRDIPSLFCPVDFLSNAWRGHEKIIPVDIDIEY